MIAILMNGIGKIKLGWKHIENKKKKRRAEWVGMTEDQKRDWKGKKRTESKTRKKKRKDSYNWIYGFCAGRERVLKKRAVNEYNENRKKTKKKDDRRWRRLNTNRLKIKEDWETSSTSSDYCSDDDNDAKNRMAQEQEWAWEKKIEYTDFFNKHGRYHSMDPNKYIRRNERNEYRELRKQTGQRTKRVKRPESKDLDGYQEFFKGLDDVSDMNDGDYSSESESGSEKGEHA